MQGRIEKDPTKPKLDHFSEPSSASSGRRVLLLRNLPPSVLDRDVEIFITPFARSVSPKIYLQFAAGQAFVEFGTAQEAETAFKYFKDHPTSLKGQIVSVFFSDRSAVTAPDERSANFRVLLATVTNLMYPVDIELLRFLFTRFGRVQKIISFSKSNSSTTFQALIQMADASMAVAALKELHGRNIYDGCNTLQIQPSRLAELVVRTNNSRAWDYTVAPEGVPSRPSEIRSSPDMRPSAPQVSRGGGDENCSPSNGLNRFNSPGFQRVFQMARLPREAREWKAALLSQSTSSLPTAVLIVYNLTPGAVTVTELFNVFSTYGVLLRIKILRDKPHTALLQYSDPLYASFAAHFLQGAPLFDEDPGMQIGFSRNAEVKLSNAVGPDALKRTRAFQPQEQRYSAVSDSGSPPDLATEVEKYVRAVCPPTCTLFIANLRDNIEESELRDLVRPFGEVKRIELKSPSVSASANGRRFAMVEMSSRLEGLQAVARLHNQTVGGLALKVAFSKTQLGGGRTASSSSASSSSSSSMAGGARPKKSRVGTASTTD